MILHGFLFHISKICYSSSSDRVSGDSIEIFMRCESVVSPRQFLNCVFIIFIWEKERSTEAVPTGIAKHSFVRILKFGHIVSDINCSFMSSFGCYIPSETFPLG